MWVGAGAKQKMGSSLWKERYTSFMMVWAIASHLAAVLQAIKIYRTQDVSGIALEMYIITIVGTLFWFIHGYWVMEPRNWIIVISSILSFLIQSSIIIGIFIYG
jgi:uncharacterized protein with PQ loop repeat